MELAAGYAEDVADLCTIPRLTETGALHEAAEAIDCLGTLIRDQIPRIVVLLDRNGALTESDQPRGRWR